MKLIVGLGNPGPRYRHTRHNVGYRVLDLVAERLGLTFDREKYGGLVATGRWEQHALLLLKPLTFMNNSGLAVARAAKNRLADAADLLVVLDDIHLPLGRLRLREGGSAGGHNGLRSVIEHLGTQAFPRLRIGVGKSEAGRRLTDHVLSSFFEDERAEVERAIEAAAAGVVVFVRDGIREAMNRSNTGARQETPNSEA